MRDDSLTEYMFDLDLMEISHTRTLHLFHYRCGCETHYLARATVFDAMSSEWFNEFYCDDHEVMK